MGIIYHENDYEIIHLIQEGNEEAFTLMVNKYTRFIAKKIHKFNLAYDFDDLFQEGILILYRSVMVFDDTFNKTFTRFFEMNLERHFISTINTLKHRRHLHYIHQEEIQQNTQSINEISAYYGLHLAEIKKSLTDIEYRVYILRDLMNYSADAIATMLERPVKVIYNSLHRAKAKIQALYKE